MTYDTRRLWLRVATAIVLFACGMRSFAQDTPEARPAAVSTEAASIDSPVQTHHAITVEGGQLDYIATAGTLRVRQDKGDAEAAVFYVSYRKDGEDAATRPITFVFNGGPGSSAAWLHMGGLGPRRLALDDDGAVPARSGPAGRQRADLAALHRSRLRRSGRHRVQPRHRLGGKQLRRSRAPLLGHQERPALSGRVHPSLPHRQRSLGIAQVSGGRELRRVSCGSARRRPACTGGNRTQWSDSHFTRHRLHAQPLLRLPES